MLESPQQVGVNPVSGAAMLGECLRALVIIGVELAVPPPGENLRRPFPGVVRRCALVQATTQEAPLSTGRA